MRFNYLLFGIFCSVLAACGTKPIAPSDKHLQRSDTESGRNAQVPQAIKRVIPLAPPQTAAKIETYSVVVTQVPAHEILFALARDAKINLDIHGGIQGNVTLNAINQTLPQILDRMAKQVDIRYELNGANLTVMPDSPYLKHYKIDYVNMSRDSEGTMSNSTQVGSNSSGSATGTGGSSSNNSSLTIKNSTKNNFWVTLTQNIKDILRETDKVFPAGSSETVVEQNNNISTSGTGIQSSGSNKKSPNKTNIENSSNPASLQADGATITRTSTFREAASVIPNPETGIITVRATGKQHEKIQEFVDQIMLSARRQVLIEATIVEVRLNDNYQQGIDWSRLRAVGAIGFSATQAATGVQAAANTGQILNVNYLTQFRHWVILPPPFHCWNLLAM